MVKDVTGVVNVARLKIIAKVVTWAAWVPGLAEVIGTKVVWTSRSIMSSRSRIKCKITLKSSMRSSAVFEVKCDMSKWKISATKIWYY